jgi:hypothetical protein
VAPAENRDNAPGVTVRFTLPCQPNTYLIPNVTFNCNLVVATAALSLDHGAGALIERLRIYHGSQLLEDISQYARLRQIITDISQSPVNQSTVTNLLEASPQGTHQLAAADVAINAFIPPDIENVCERGQIPTVDPTYLPAGQEHPLVISLASGIIGSLAQKACPVHAGTGSPLRIELVLSSNNKAIVCDPGQTAGAAAGAGTWELHDCELHATYVQVSSNAQALIDQAVGGVYALNTYTYTHSQQTAVLGDTDGNVLLPFSYSSLKHVITGLYQSGVEDRLHFNVSGRNQCNVDEVFWQIGAARVPSQPLKGYLQVMNEAFKVYGVSSDILQICNNCDRENSALTSTPPLAPRANANEITRPIRVGKFAMGLDLEAWGATSSATRIENGINTTAIQMYVNWKCSNADNMTINTEVHTWGCYDLLVTAQNGQFYARF